MTIRIGATGADVVLWQRVLGVPADGDFGPNTDAATKAWQTQHGLEPDGVVGSATWAAAGVADGEQVEVKRTVVTLREFTRAVLRAWSHVGQGHPTKEAIAVLWAQNRIETGGDYCWNWNIANVKKVPGDGFNFHCLNNVWEGYAPVDAARLIASGEAREDKNADHAKAVGVDRVSVLFNPPHRQTQFRAFASLDAAMGEHLELLAHKRYTTAWPSVLAGDYRAFAQALKERGYFTAAASAYAAGMAPAFTSAMTSSAYEDALEELEADEQRDTIPELPEPPSEQTIVVEQDQPIIHRYDYAVPPGDDGSGV